MGGCHRSGREQGDDRRRRRRGRVEGVSHIVRKVGKCGSDDTDLLWSGADLGWPVSGRKVADKAFQICRVPSSSPRKKKIIIIQQSGPAISAVMLWLSVCELQYAFAKIYIQ